MVSFLLSPERSKAASFYGVRGGRTFGATVIAAVALGGCIPRIASAPPATIVPSPTIPTADAPRLDLDLSKLSDTPTAWEVRPVAAAAVEVAAARYVVKAGDTLRGIGEATGAGSDAIAHANGLIAPFVVKAGQVLTISGGRYHRVREGETGIAIARAYGTAWGGVVTANALAEPFVLRVGQRLVLPGNAAATAPVTPEARAAAFQIGIDDLVTGSEPARTIVATTATPTPVTAPTTLAPARFVWPLNGAIVSRFGRIGNGRANQGIDIAATDGARISAASAGTVAYVGTGVPGYGGLVLVRHDGNWISAYGRVANASVIKGETVRSGQTLGKSGIEPLHFELRRARVPVDPVKYLPTR